MKKTTGWTTFQIAEKLKIDLQRLRGWARHRYVLPSIQQSSGPGTKAIFSLEDVYQIVLFQRLVERGYTRTEASDDSHFVHGDKQGNRPRFLLIWADETGERRGTWALQGLSAMTADMKRKVWSDFTVINLEALRKKVDEDLEIQKGGG